MSSQNFMSPARPPVMMPQLSPQGDNRLISSLQNEVKELRQELRHLRPELKRQEELVGFEKDQVSSLTDKLEKLKIKYEKEVGYYQTLTTQLEHDISNSREKQNVLAG